VISRERERERDDYQQLLDYHRAERDRSFQGKVVIHARDIPLVQNRMALRRKYMWPSQYTGQPAETVLDGWTVFVQTIYKHSGRHKHQGGLVIYILEGEGYSVVDGERHDWEAGDLLLLPLKLGGVDHQHFNKDDSKPVRWIAFINVPLFTWGSSEMVQIENHPEFDGQVRQSWQGRR
jgi:gentisate 1,2-dioxygenase